MRLNEGMDRPPAEMQSRLREKKEVEGEKFCEKERRSVERGKRSLVGREIFFVKI